MRWKLRGIGRGFMENGVLPSDIAVYLMERERLIQYFGRQPSVTAARRRMEGPKGVSEDSALPELRLRTEAEGEFKKRKHTLTPPPSECAALTLRHGPERHKDRGARHLPEPRQRREADSHRLHLPPGGRPHSR